MVVWEISFASRKRTHSEERFLRPPRSIVLIMKSPATGWIKRGTWKALGIEDRRRERVMVYSGPAKDNPFFAKIWK